MAKPATEIAFPNAIAEGGVSLIKLMQEVINPLAFSPIPDALRTASPALILTCCI